MGNEPVGDVETEANSLVRELVRVVGEPPTLNLEAIELAVERFVARIDWSEVGLAPAASGEERLYRLDGEERDGPAVYLVSDGVGVTSPPHEHETWAVVAGIAGEEINHVFTRTSIATRAVTKAETLVVGPGQALGLAADTIHATAVAGDSPTFHVHVYGQALTSLSSFERRCFIDAAGVEPPLRHEREHVVAPPSLSDDAATNQTEAIASPGGANG